MILLNQWESSSHEGAKKTAVQCNGRQKGAITMLPKPELQKTSPYAYPFRKTNKTNKQTNPTTPQLVTFPLWLFHVPVFCRIAIPHKLQVTFTAAQDTDRWIQDNTWQVPLQAWHKPVYLLTHQTQHNKSCVVTVKISTMTKCRYQQLTAAVKEIAWDGRLRKLLSIIPCTIYIWNLVLSLHPRWTEIPVVQVYVCRHSFIVKESHQKKVLPAFAFSSEKHGFILGQAWQS